MASHHQSACKKAARPPADPPEITTSDALASLWSARSAASVALRMARPLKCSTPCVSFATASPTKEPPSQ